MHGRALEIEQFAVARIAPPDDLIDKATVGLERVKGARAAQQQRIHNRFLQMAMRALDCAVLMRQTRIVAARRHAVMGAQRLIASGEIRAGIAVEVAERGRQAVAAMLQRHGTERPQCVLQALGQGHKALAAEHDVRVLPAAEG